MNQLMLVDDTTKLRVERVRSARAPPSEQYRSHSHIRAIFCSENRPNSPPLWSWIGRLGYSLDLFVINQRLSDGLVPEFGSDPCRHGPELHFALIFGLIWVGPPHPFYFFENVNDIVCANLGGKIAILGKTYDRQRPESTPGAFH